MLVTRLTFHIEISSLNASRPSNNLDMSVTSATHHDPMGHPYVSLRSLHRVATARQPSLTYRSTAALSSLRSAKHLYNGFGGDIVGERLAEEADAEEEAAVVEIVGERFAEEVGAKEEEAPVVATVGERLPEEAAEGEEAPVVAAGVVVAAVAVVVIFPAVGVMMLTGLGRENATPRNPANKAVINTQIITMKTMIRFCFHHGSSGSRGVATYTVS
jgi:hypothetical protein